MKLTLRKGFLEVKTLSSVFFAMFSLQIFTLIEKRLNAKVILTFDLVTTLFARYLDSFTWETKGIYYEHIAVPSHSLNRPITGFSYR